MVQVIQGISILGSPNTPGEASQGPDILCPSYFTEGTLLGCRVQGLLSGHGNPNLSPKNRKTLNRFSKLSGSCFRNSAPTRPKLDIKTRLKIQGL